MVDIGPRADQAGSGERLNDKGSESLPLRSRAGCSESRKGSDFASQVDGLAVGGWPRDGSRAEVVEILAAAGVQMLVRREDLPPQGSDPRPEKSSDARS